MKVVNIDNISQLSSRTMVTVGMFDGLHVGHQHLLRFLMSTAEANGLTPVVVTFDAHPRVVLGLTDHHFRQLMTTQERLAALEAFGVPMVALVHFTPEVASLSACDFALQYLVGRLNVGALLLGYDNMFGSKRNNDFSSLPQLAVHHGFAIYNDSAVVLEGVEVSSTQIRNALQEGDMRRVNDMLGSVYSLSGSVVHGRHVGRSIGFPTANIELSDPFKAIPAPGVYAVLASFDGESHLAMANVGPRPTFMVDHFAIEVHLLDFEGDLYGRQLTVHFYQRIRDISRFNSVEQLVAQLRADRDHVRRLLP